MRYLIRRPLYEHFIQARLIYRNLSKMTDIISNEKTKFETLNFDNLTLRTLPIDPIEENYVREVKNACFSKVKPMVLNNPKMVAFSHDAMSLLDLDQPQLERKDAAEYLSGNKPIPGSETAAHCYCGHQFGVFAGQLGDGAAMYLGEIINKKGKRWEMQFKGAGLTPYSRSADGRKVLRSTLREFLCSEANFYLGIATTRAGSCISSDSTVIRDMFYDGNPKLEKCAVVLRIAETFIRFGSFEIFLPLDRTTGGRGPSYGNVNLLETLLDFVCDNYFRELIIDKNNKQLKYEMVFEEIVKRTAILVADWQCFGFVHGVLNTDNMSIVGLTIDYGPYGFLERYDPGHIFNGSDSGGRYTYENQPKICEWNCVKLAEALNPLLPIQKSKEIVEKTFKKEYNQHYLEKMRKKLGLFTNKPDDEKLIKELFDVMYETGVDFTNSFRKLSLLDLNVPDEIDKDIKNFITIILNECRSLEESKNFLKPKFPRETLDKLLAAMREQPGILDYFGLSEKIVNDDVKNSEKYDKIISLEVDDKAKLDSEIWSNWLKKYIKRIYDELDINSVDETTKKKRIQMMNSNNPRFVLRNHLAQEAIDYADEDKFVEAKMLLKLLENPFSDEPLTLILNEFISTHSKMIEERSLNKFYEKPPEQNKCIKLTCSS